MENEKKYLQQYNNIYETTLEYFTFTGTQLNEY